MRTAVMGTLTASLVLWAAGCGKRPGPAPGPEPADPSASVPISVNVKGMTKALEIT